MHTSWCGACSSQMFRQADSRNSLQTYSFVFCPYDLKHSWLVCPRLQSPISDWTTCVHVPILNPFLSFVLPKFFFSRGAVVISKVGGVPCLWQLTNLLLVPALQIWPTPEQGKKSLENYPKENNFAQTLFWQRKFKSTFNRGPRPGQKKTDALSGESRRENVQYIHFKRSFSYSFFQRGEAGRGEVKNPRGGAKVKIRGAGQKST